MKITRIDKLHGNNVIWRYMSFEKFIDLILHNHLYFSNAKNMEDRFEMEIPAISLDNQKKFYISRGLPENKAKKSVEKEIHLARIFKENTYINCWSLDASESYALWKIYLGGSPNGVAIKTTVSKLESNLKSRTKTIQLDNFDDINFDLNSALFEIDEFNLAEVKYKNFLKIEDLNKYNIAITKRKYYKYEKEVRVFGTSNNQHKDPNLEEYKLGIENGISINIDSNNLIDKIVLSPFSTSWFRENIKLLVKKIDEKLLEKIIDSEILINR
jgi:hypothetical protein